jgi:hypothetical protein
VRELMAEPYLISFVHLNIFSTTDFRKTGGLIAFYLSPFTCFPFLTFAFCSYLFRNFIAFKPLMSLKKRAKGKVCFVNMPLFHWNGSGKR